MTLFNRNSRNDNKIALRLTKMITSAQFGTCSGDRNDPCTFSFHLTLFTSLYMLSSEFLGTHFSPELT